MASADITTVPLETPLEREKGTTLTELRFRRPVSGDLRGVSIARLGQLDYDEVRKLAPRISIDGVVDTQFDTLDTADMIEIALAFSDFLQTRARRADSPTA